jgi:nucleotide-binding universal stress UspA family protein
MGTHGRSGVGRWVLGSVADKVVHEAHAPVLLARPPKAGSPPRSSIVEKILVPLDGSELSQSALPLAETMAELLDASIVLFHAITPPVITFPGTEAITMNQPVWDGLRDDARKFLRSVGDQVSARGHRAEEIVSIAPIVDGILCTAENQSAGLIVMSTHGRSGVGRWIMGSVTDGVVRRSSLPVLAVRPAGTENEA